MQAAACSNLDYNSIKSLGCEEISGMGSAELVSALDNSCNNNNQGINHRTQQKKHLKSKI